MTRPLGDLHLTGVRGFHDELPIHQSNTVPFGDLYTVEDPREGKYLLLPRSRPTLIFPLTESVALSSGIRPWYWDVASWPFRQPLSAREYLKWLGLTP